MLSIDKEIFAENLLLTQVYCEERLKDTDKSDAEILRSINPIRNGKPVFKFNNYEKTKVFVDVTIDHYENGVYESLFEEQLVFKKKVVQLVPGIFEGRVLIANIGEAIPDGASEQETDGFIDGNDCPAIDTWFYMVKSDHGEVVFTWVPARFVKSMQNGIDVNALDIFRWADDFNNVECFHNRYDSNKNISKISSKTLSNNRFWLIFFALIYILAYLSTISKN